MDHILESFNLDPLISFETVDPMIFFKEDGFDELDQILTEATSAPVPKKNLGQKLLDLLKRLWELIAKAGQAIARFFKNLFKKKAKTTDQILLELGVISKKDIKEGKVRIPRNDESTVAIGDTEIDVMIKPLMMKINDDSSITLTTKEINQAAFMRYKQGKIKGQKGNWAGAVVVKSHIYALKFIENKDDCQGKLKKIADAIGNKDLNFSVNMDYNSLWMNIDSWGVKYDEEHKVTLQQIQDFQECLTYVNKAISSIDSPSDEEWTHGYINMLNYFSNSVASLQMGMNIITEALKGIYVVDASFCDTIKDPETLSKFVQKCIESSVPAKYLATNTYLVSHRDLKGNGDALNPVWGQSRAVFFPEVNKDVCYKIALSQWGIRANKSEAEIFKKADDAGKGSIFAAVKDLTTNGAVSTVERVDTSKKANQVQINKLHEDLRAIASDLKIPLTLEQDIHKNNVGWHNGVICALDYGLVSRKFA